MASTIQEQIEFRNTHMYQSGEIMEGNGYCNNVKLESTEDPIICCKFCNRMSLSGYETSIGICDIYCHKSIESQTHICTQWIPHQRRLVDVRMKKQYESMLVDRIRYLANQIKISQEIKVEKLDFQKTDAFGKIFMDGSHCIGLTTKDNPNFQAFSKDYPNLWVEVDKKLLYSVLDSTSTRSIRLKMKPMLPLLLKDADSKDVWLIANHVEQEKIANSEIEG